MPSTHARGDALVPTSVRFPVLAGIRRWRPHLRPRKRSTSTPNPPVAGNASVVARHEPIRSRKRSYRVGELPYGPGRNCPNSSSSSISGHQGPSQNPSLSSGIRPTATHDTPSACSGGQAVRIGSTTIPENSLPQDLSTRRNDASPTQAPLNACPSGGAVQIRQTRPASGESAPAKSKRRKLGSQPPAGPSPELLAKLALKFPHLMKHPKGDG